MAFYGFFIVAFQYCTSQFRIDGSAVHIPLPLWARLIPSLNHNMIFIVETLLLILCPGGKALSLE